jgi:hypothetical protein
MTERLGHSQMEIKLNGSAIVLGWRSALTMQND